MTSKTTPAVNRRVAPLARVLAFVLLAFVTHSATTEIVHQHGSLLSARAAALSGIVDASTEHSSSESSRSTGECLICQLQQHLFSTLLISVPGIAPPQVEEALACQADTSSAGEAQATQRGRAPPQTSPL